MKRLALLLLLAVATGFAAQAQKFAYVDTEYILNSLDRYKQAQKDLDDLSVQWQKTIEAKYAEIDRLYKAYQAEQILLTDDMKRKREDEIIAKEKEAKDYQKAKFGVDGELFQKRQELIKPIQDEVYAAIQEVAEQGSYAVIFDRANQSNILYSNPRYDKSDSVLKILKAKGN
ncbi:MAG: OmpH family outer membrane protein [Salibacteraceae bacterium]